MASDVKCFGIIHITKLDRKTVKQPIGIPKKCPLRFEDESVKTEIVQKFYLSGQN